DDRAVGNDPQDRTSAGDVTLDVNVAGALDVAVFRYGDDEMPSRDLLRQDVSRFIGAEILLQSCHDDPGHAYSSSEEKEQQNAPSTSTTRAARGRRRGRTIERFEPLRLRLSWIDRRRHGRYSFVR